jgi:hypothetical protein
MRWRTGSRSSSRTSSSSIMRGQVGVSPAPLCSPRSVCSTPPSNGQAPTVCCTPRCVIYGKHRTVPDRLTKHLGDARGGRVTSRVLGCVTTITGWNGVTRPGLGLRPFPTDVRGRLTIRDVSRDERFSATVLTLAREYQADVTTAIKMADYGIPYPRMFIFQARDPVTITLHIVARRPDLSRATSLGARWACAQRGISLPP